MERNYTDIKIPLGERLKTYRTNKGLSLKETATLVGVPKTTYREWEEGRKVSNHNALIKLAIVFELTLYELLSGHETKNENLLNCINDIEKRLLELKNLILIA